MDDETVVVDEGTETGFTLDTENMPTWLVELIDRLMQVLTKLLIKFGLKLAF